MAYFIRELLTPVPSEEKQELLFSTLAERYMPLLRSAYSKMREGLGLSPDSPIFALPGEIFLGNPQQFFYCVKFSSGLEIGALSNSNIQVEYQSFTHLVISILGSNLERRPLYSVNPVFSVLYADYGGLQISQEERKASQLLSDKKTREFLQDIFQGAGGKKVDPHDGLNSAILEELENLGIIKQEFLIFCRKTGNQIMMVESMDAIKEASEQGFKCFACGHPFSEEALTQLIALTTSGRKILSSNRWLTTSVLELLDELPEPKASCASSENNVTTLFLNIETSLILIEMKDSPYHLKDAYLLKKKMSIYKPAFTFLLLLSPPSQELQKYLESMKVEIALAWGSSIADLKTAIPKILSKAHQSHLGEMLQRFTHFSLMGIGELAYSYFFPHLNLPRMTSFPEPPEPIQAFPMQISVQKTPETKTLPSVSHNPFVENRVTAPIQTKEQVVQKILRELSSGVAERESSLHILFQDLTEVNRRYKACLFSSDGLVIASTLPEELSEVLASYGGECFSLTHTILKEQNLPTLDALTLASSNFSVDLYPAPGFFLGVATPLEITVAEKISDSQDTDGLKIACNQLLEKKAVKSVQMLNKDGVLLFNSRNQQQEDASPLLALLKIFPKLALSFNPLEQGNLESIAVRTPSCAVLLSRAGTGYIATTCEMTQPWEELIPYLLALGTEVSRFF